MLYNPYLGEIIPATVADRYAQIEIDLIIAFAKRAKSNDFTTQWYANKLKAMGILREDLEAIIRKNFPYTQKEISQIMEQASFRYLSINERVHLDAVKAGIVRPTPPIPESIILRNILEASYSQAIDKMNQVNTTAVNMAIDVLDKALTFVVTGTDSLNKAVNTAVDELMSDGVKGAVFPSGRTMRIEPYVNMVVRSSTMNVTRKLSFARLEEYGCDLLKISAHAGARELCFPYQGRIFSLSGDDKDFPAFSTTSYGEIAGLFGINCRHYPFPYYKELGKPPTEEDKDPAKLLDKTNKEVYEASQEQRYIERKIREWKARANDLDTNGLDNKKAKAKISEWQARMRKFTKETGRKRRYEREKVA